MKALRTPKKVFIFIALLVAGGLIIAYAIGQDESGENQGDSAGSIREDTIKDDPTSGGNTTKSPSQEEPQGSGSSGNPNISLEVSQTSQLDNGDLVIQTKITGAGSGICELSLTKGTKVISRSVGVLFQPTISTCKGFTIPIDDFSEAGVWNLILNLKINGQQEARVIKDINVKK